MLIARLSKTTQSTSLACVSKPFTELPKNSRREPENTSCTASWIAALACETRSTISGCGTKLRARFSKNVSQASSVNFTVGGTPGMSSSSRRKTIAASSRAETHGGKRLRRSIFSTSSATFTGACKAVHISSTPSNNFKAPMPGSAFEGGDGSLFCCAATFSNSATNSSPTPAVYQARSWYMRRLRLHTIQDKPSGVRRCTLAFNCGSMLFNSAPSATKGYP
mmetsp:Transcript_168186/g.540318  ORF Transcript_168186/g.540318 Transcript_168186/m.540318 type:complete len:222 (-) Transcript_168186:179-844(-)